MSAGKWAAVVLVLGLGVAVAGQAAAGTDLQQKFKSAQQSGGNLIEVLQLELQSGARLDDVAAAAGGAGIAADIVTAAALGAGLEAVTVARTVERNLDTNLGYVQPPVSLQLSGTEATSGITVLAGTTSGENQDRMANSLKPCKEKKRCAISVDEWCCEQNSSDLDLCPDKCKKLGP